MSIKLPKKVVGDSPSAATPAVGEPISSPPVKAIEAARSDVEKMLGDIRAAHESGDYNKAQALAEEYLASSEARLAATYEAFGDIRPDRRPDPCQLLGIAASLNAWAGTREPVLIRGLSKVDPDEFGDVLDFGIENLALQYLVGDVLDAQWNSHPDQYGMRGSPAALKCVAGLMDQGYRWAIATEIFDCYLSFDGKKVAQLLPLPKEVTQMVALGEHLSITSGNRDDEFFRRGLPPGAATSPLIANMLLAQVYEKLPQCGRTISHGRNFLVMGQSESDLAATATALVDAIGAHPAGQFQLNDPRVFEPGDAVDFLSQRLQLIRGHVRVDPVP